MSVIQQHSLREQLHNLEHQQEGKKDQDNVSSEACTDT